MKLSKGTKNIIVLYSFYAVLFAMVGVAVVFKPLPVWVTAAYWLIVPIGWFAGRYTSRWED